MNNKSKTVTSNTNTSARHFYTDLMHCIQQFSNISSLLPALFGVLVSLVIELQRYFGIQPDAKIVIHHTLFCALPVEQRDKHDELCKLSHKRIDL